MAVVSKELVIDKSINIDKNDITDIAIARVEEKIRVSIQTIQKQVKLIDARIDTEIESLKAAGKKACDLKSKARVNRLSKVVATADKVKLKGFSVATHYDFPLDAKQDYEHFVKRRTNSFTVILRFEDPVRQLTSETITDKDSFALNQQQKAIAKKIIDLRQDRQDLVNEGLEWRRKMGDIPTIERQFKAKLAETQLRKTKEGQAIIENLIKNLDNDMKLLGV